MVKIREFKINSEDWIETFNGAFDYYEGDTPYSEEKFQVYKNEKNGGTLFLTEALSRTTTGEFLRIYTFYQLDREFVPEIVKVKRYMGNVSVEENFKLDKKTNLLRYDFISSKEQRTSYLQVPPKYQISTSSIVTSNAFLSAKKYDNTGKNYHNIVHIDNIWEYTNEPKNIFVIVIKRTNTPVDLMLKGKKLSATIFDIYSNDDYENTKEKPLRYYLSKHLNIPYLIVGENRMKIEVRFLNEVEKTNIEESYNEESANE